MTKKKERTVKRTLRASKRNYKEEREMFLGLLK